VSCAYVEWVLACDLDHKYMECVLCNRGWRNSSHSLLGCDTIVMWWDTNVLEVLNPEDSNLNLHCHWTSSLARMEKLAQWGVSWVEHFTIYC